MAVGKVSAINNITGTTAVQNVTSTSKNLQNQLLAKQQNLKKITTDSTLSLEEREKQRQKLEKEIEELKRRLEQIQLKAKEAEKSEKEIEEVESEKEVEETKEEKKEDVSAFVKEEEIKKQEQIPAEDVQKILHHNLYLKDEMVEQGVAYDKENTVRLLYAEIHQDEIRGMDTSSKEEDVKELQEKENFWEESKNKKLEDEKSKVINPDMQVVIS